jgi:thymidylate kinase
MPGLGERQGARGRLPPKKFRRRRPRKSAATEETTSLFFGEPLVGFISEIVAVWWSRVWMVWALGSCYCRNGWNRKDLRQTSGLRRSNWWAATLMVLAKNARTQLTLADVRDGLSTRWSIASPNSDAGTVVLQIDSYSLMRGVVRGQLDFMGRLYAMAVRPHLTFWLNVRPETAFGREFKKAQAISYWEAGRDMSLSHDLYWSFIRYQTMIKREFEVMAKRHGFIELDGEASVSAVNKQLRQRIGEQLGIRSTKYTPSAALAHLWR